MLSLRVKLPVVFHFVAIAGSIAFLAATLFLFPESALAQASGSIVGKVIDVKTGEPLPGANVFIKGTKRGAATGVDGTYRIPNVSSGAYTILVSFIGYHTMEQAAQVAANQETTLNFSMRPSALQMDEIIVTGTGYELKKKELTTSISTINIQQIQASPSQSIDQLLSGRVPGGVSNVNTGEPGTGARIRMRGIKSATVSQTPVIYVDGVRVDNNDRFRLSNFTGGPTSSALSDILVGDIERVEVTKGGASATLYGSEAASGVIQVFTKKGKAGPPRWSLKVEQGIDAPEEKFIIEDLTKNRILDTGHYQKYSLGLDGGSEVLTYNLSAHVLGSDGILPKSADKQYSFRTGIRVFPSEKWQIDFSSGLVRDDYDRMFSDNAIASVFGSVEGHDAEFFGAAVTEEMRRDLLQQYFAPDLDEAVNRFTFGSTANFKPNDIFSTRLTMGMDYRKNEQRYYIPFLAAGIASRPGGGLDRADREFLTVTVDYAGTIRYPSQGNITSAFTFGAQGFREEDRTSRVTANQFGLPGTDDFDNAATLAPQESNFEIFSGGFFFNEQLGFKDKIFLNAGIRIDGNTAFGDEVSLQSYPKVGLAYSLSDETFWEGLPWGSVLNQFKVRGSYGKTGQFPDPFTRDRQFTQGSFLTGVAANFGNPGDPTLGPEKTSTIEYGFDAALLNDRIGLEFTVFDEKTEDALFSVPEDPSTGQGVQLRNIGTVENSGLELALDATILNSRNFRLSIRGSFSTLDNKVVSLGGSQPFSIGGFAFLPLRVEEGYPVGVFRTTRPNDNPNTTAKESATEFKFSPVPDNYYDIGLDLTLFRNLNLSFIGVGQTGGEILNTGSVIRFFNNASPEKAAGIPAGYAFDTASEVFVEDASFFKIREIAASYRLPNNYFGTQVTLNASARNVLIIADNKDLDPELNGVRAGRDVDVGGINFFTLSPPRQFRFGLTLGF
jgi:outer membrane receptor protein involved in Fe transport